MFRVAILLTCMLLPHLAFAKAEGVDSRKAISPNDPLVSCGSAADGEAAGCHFTDANPELMVTIEGKSEIGVGLDAAELYTASVPAGPVNPCENQAVPNLVGAGINVQILPPNTLGCALEGFDPPNDIGPQNDSLDPDYVLSHIGNDTPPANLEGVWSYQFLLSCLAPGTVSLRVAMNAFDGNGAEDCEIWNSTKRDITVPEPGGAMLGAAVVAALATVERVRSRS